MKRGLVFTLCALAVAASASDARAQALGALDVALSLNLRYDDPADPSEGGKWYLVAKTGSTDGISAVSAYLTNINTAGMVLGNGGVAGNGYASVTAANIASIVSAAPNSPYNALQSSGTIINLVYGQDTSATGALALDVGNGGAPGLIAIDPLKNTAWNNAALLASGTFGATRPAFSTTAGFITDANVLPAGATTLPANNSLDANTTTVVRGDSTSLEGAGKGLLGGDANRDGTVNGADFAILSGQWQQSNKTWDQGNFNDDVGGTGIVNGADFAILSGNWQQSRNPIAVVAIPEPATGALVAIAGLMVASIARRRSA